jgi:hypothetical protein
MKLSQTLDPLFKFPNTNSPLRKQKYRYHHSGNYCNNLHKLMCKLQIDHPLEKNEDDPLIYLLLKAVLTLSHFQNTLLASTTAPQSYLQARHSGE